MYRVFTVPLLLLICCLWHSLSFAQAMRKVVIEEITASWCGLCPSGIYTLHEILSQYPQQVIGVASHVSDPMETPESLEFANIYSGGGVNLFLLDRYLFPSEQFIQFTYEYEPLEEAILARFQMTAPISVSIENATYDKTTRELSATVTATAFQTIANHNLKFNLWLTEDSVYSTQSGYEQINFFNNYPGHYFTNAGNPISPFAHRHVWRKALGGNWGTDNSLPQLIQQGQSYSFTYTTSLSTEWDDTKIHLVGLVQNDGLTNMEKEILNAESVRLSDVIDNTTTATTSLNRDSHSLLAYPSPSTANEQVTIAFNLPISCQQLQLAVYDMQGNRVAQLLHEPVGVGMHSIVWDKKNENRQAMPTGMYFIILTTDRGERQSAKVVVGL